MSTEENKALIRRTFEKLNQGNLAFLDELLTPDFVFHDPANPTIHSHEDYIRLHTALYAAFSDIHFSAEEMLAEEDKVAYWYTFRATQSGSWRGAAPTGKPITFSAMCIDRITEGKIAEEWHIADVLGMVQQLGLIPTSGQASQ